MFKSRMQAIVVVIVLAGFVLSGCMTLDPNASYVYKQPDSGYGTVILSNESGKDLWVWIDGKEVRVHPEKKQTPWNSGPMGLNVKETFEVNVAPGLHKLKYAIAMETGGSKADFEIEEGDKIIIRFPTAKLFGAIETGTGVSTDIKIEKLESKTTSNVNPTSQTKDVHNNDNNYQNLKNIKQLYDDGIISKEEYEQKKKQLLDGIK